MKQLLLDQSLAVRTRVLSEILPLMHDMPVLFDLVIPYTTQIIKWLSPIIDLAGWYVYPTNGITDGLNWWSHQEQRGIEASEGEYQWVKPTGTGIRYISVPECATGNFIDYPIDRPVSLDLAYIGSTNIRQIPISDNVERVFYSLSKSFGVRSIRTGWMFTRTPDIRLDDLVYGAKYYNYYAHWVAENLIHRYSVDYVWNKLRSEQLRVCKELNLIPSDSVWLATTTDPEYEKFRRKTNVARICLAGVYNYGT